MWERRENLLVVAVAGDGVGAGAADYDVGG